MRTTKLDRIWDKCKITWEIIAATLRTNSCYEIPKRIITGSTSHSVSLPKQGADCILTTIYYTLVKRAYSAINVFLPIPRNEIINLVCGPERETDSITP